jgi:cytochrome c-type biogenesis protein CcmH/NrfG
MKAANRIFFTVIFMLFACAPVLAGVSFLATAAVPVPDTLPEQQRDSILMELNLRYLNSVNDRQSPTQQIQILEEILRLDPGNYQHWFNLGFEQIKIHEFPGAIAALEKGLSLYPTVDNATLVQVYINLAYCYNKIERHQREKEVLDTASLSFPEHPGIIGRYVICAHSRVRFHEAEAHLENLKIRLRQDGMDEAQIAFHLGRLYLNTDYLVAEKYFRIAYQYHPEDPEKQGALAWVLIQNALRYKEGMALMEQAIAKDPQNPVFIHQQGYGYYIMGEYERSLKNLYAARELYQEYNFELNNHISMVEEALASRDE